MQSTGHFLFPEGPYVSGPEDKNRCKIKNPIARNGNFMKQKDKTALWGIFLMPTHREIQPRII